MVQSSCEKRADKHSRLTARKRSDKHKWGNYSFKHWCWPNEKITCSI